VGLDELLEILRTDLGDESALLFEDGTLVRCLRKAVFLVAADLDTPMKVESELIVPSPEPPCMELLLLLARIHACEVMRARTANSFSFSSGDKKVDKSKQPEAWAKLEANLRAQYSAQLREMKPELALLEDDYFIHPGRISPVVYEQGVNVCPYCQAQNATRPCPTCGR